MGWFADLVSRIWPRRPRIEVLATTPWTPPVPASLSHPTSDQKVSQPGLIRQPSPNERVMSRGLSYFVSKGSSNSWVQPQYDHVEIEVLYDVESYVARATRAKLALFMREGYEFVGPKDQRVEYIRTRIKQIERAARIPFSVLLGQTAKDLVLHSNAYWLKVRKPEASGGQVRKVGRGTRKPIAGFFPLQPETMIPEVDSGGNIVRWKQEIEGEERFYSVDDIVHFYFNRKVGYPLGIPTICPVIDDIRLLRSIEANVDVLINKHLFPILLWKVGTKDDPVRTYSDGSTEIEVVEGIVAAMPSEGSIVVPERFEVEAIGVESKALRVEGYLQHFRERLLAGLDVSSVDVGIGNTSSRSTAQTLSRNLIDIVKLFQLTIQSFVDPVIEELLLESTFSEATVLDSDNLVSLRFSEIDKEAKVARENHAADLFLKNGFTYPEFRAELGKEPLTKEEEEELYWNKFGREEALIGSVDESSGKGAAATNSVANKNAPANQHGTRSSPKLNKDLAGEVQNPNPVLLWHEALRDELQARWVEGDGTLDLALAEQDIRSSYELAYLELTRILHYIIRQNYGDPLTIHGLYREAEDRARKYVDRLRKDVLSRLKIELSIDSSPTVAFDALRYRAVLIFKTEQSFMGNLARFKWLRKQQKSARVVGQEDACEACRGQLTLIHWNDTLGEGKLPPFHPGCKCEVVAADEES